MTMNSVYNKEQEGLTPMGSPSPGSVPWWSGLVTGSTPEESIKTKPSSIDNHTPYGSKFTQITPKKSDRDAEQVFDKNDITQFNIFTGNDIGKLDQSASDSDDGKKFQADYAELAFSQPTMLRGKYPFTDQCYGVFSSYGPQITGRIMLPLNLSSDDGPTFVNAKQYHGIIRRRRSRAKAEMANKALKNRKPYLHHSRHLHAIRRPRGNGGRFLNTKKENKCKEEKKNNGNNNMFSLADLKSLPNGNNLSGVSFSKMMSGNTGSGYSFGMHGKWVAAGGDSGGRYNFTV